MCKLLRQVKLRLLILASLVFLSVYFAVPQRTASACERCVPLSGGLCVGCQQVPRGAEICVPDQETCSCSLGESCGLPY